ncbi:MAG: AMP-binding protein [Bacteroidetes bacterium]|nr:AMP-binding protein [Bacteroidota bacterium]
MNYPSIKIHLPEENSWYASDALAIRNDVKDSKKYLSALIDLLYWWHYGSDDLEVQTSGTTGVPKILRFSREEVKTSASISLKAIPILRGQHTLLAMDLKYVGAKMLVVRSLMAGADLTVVPPTSNPLLFQSPIKFHYASFVPFQINQILGNLVSKEQLNNIDTVLIGGGPLQSNVAEILSVMKGDFIHTYGMSETLSHVAIRRIKDQSDLYTLLEGYQYQIEHDGFLSVISPFQKEVIKTMDIAESISSTTFRLLGRADLLVNSGGVKLFPDLMEHKVRKVIQEFPGIKDFMFTGIPDSMLGEKMILLIEGDQVLASDNLLILEKIRPLLNRYEVPKEIYNVGSFARNENGKIDRTRTLKEFLKGR